MTSEAKHTPELALPWSSTANSWQYTTIYDGHGVPVCRFDLEDWDVDEDNQDKLEARQAAVVASVVAAVNSHADLVEMARLFERTIEYEIRKSDKEGDDEGARLKSFTLARVRAALALASPNTGETK